MPSTSPLSLLSEIKWLPNKKTNTRQVSCRYAPTETNISPLEIGPPKMKVVFQPSIFRGELLVSGRVSRLPIYNIYHLFFCSNVSLPMILLMEEILHQYGKYAIMLDGFHTPSQVGKLAGFLPTIKTVESLGLRSFTIFSYMKGWSFKEHVANILFVPWILWDKDHGSPRNKG